MPGVAAAVGGRDRPCTDQLCARKHRRKGESYLAKLRLGPRAIERETSHLPTAAPILNKDLESIGGGLTAVDATLGELHKALVAQERRS